jgi:3-oxoacyl-[acyl-carrier protein] reductase
VSYHRAVPAALVTGATGGIGPAVVAALADDGWTVATTDLGGDVSVRADLGDTAAAASIFEAVGAVDALVAVHTVSERGGLLKTDADQIDRHLAVNVRGTLLLMAEFARRFRGEAGSGRIVTFTSGLPLTGEIAYAASKGAVAWLTVSAAVELAQRGITVNAIDPGPTDTGWMTADLKAAVEQATPLGRTGHPEDAARLVAFLCSREAGWITGQVLRSDGGFAWQRFPRRAGDVR